MALSANPTIGQITLTTDGSTTIITDGTSYVTPELSRAEVAVFLLPYKVDEDLVKTALVAEEADPAVATSWVVQNTTDGYQTFVMLIIPSYTTAPTFPALSVVYDVSSNQIYQNISGGEAPSVPLAESETWAIITAEQAYQSLNTATEPPNLVVGEVSTVLTIKAKQCLGNIAPRHAKENCPGCPGNQVLKEQFDDLWLLIYLASIASSRQMYVEGERLMRSAENYCDCGCN